MSEGMFSEKTRTAAHGVSAAIGKLGAVLGGLIINYVSKNNVE